MVGPTEADGMTMVGGAGARDVVAPHAASTRTTIGASGRARRGTPVLYDGPVGQRSTVFALVFLAMAGAAPPTAASVCLGPDQVALPMVDRPAPTNTHVWLFVSRFVRERGCAKPPCEGRFVLRTAAGMPDAREVPLGKVTETTSGNLVAIELVPARDLPPLRAFETWWVPKEAGVPRLMSAFRTGAARDETPPSPLTARRAFRYAVTSVLHEPDVEQVVVEGEPSLDDGAPAPLYAVWLGADGDATRPPDAILDRALMSRDDVYRPRVLVAGTGASCFTSLTVGRGVAGKTLIVRPMDLAGNMGPTAVAVVAPR